MTIWGCWDKSRIKRNKNQEEANRRGPRATLLWKENALGSFRRAPLFPQPDDASPTRARVTRNLAEAKRAKECFYKT